MAGEPERTCVGCRGKAAKRSLLRIALSGPGRVSVDPAAVIQGRGVYIHRSQTCVDQALRRRGTIERALRTRLADGEVARLRAEIEGILD
jgi:hypothetical protein